MDDWTQTTTPGPLHAPAPIPAGFQAQLVEINGITLNVIHNAQAAYDGQPLDDSRPPLLLLHGFPEFWYAWHRLMPLLSPHFLVVVPDQRGCGQSDMPMGQAHYQTRHLTGDACALTRALFGPRPYALAGHDFGAGVAYAIAMRDTRNQTGQVRKLVVLNGPHPVAYQNELVENPDQARNSAYFHQIKAKGAGQWAAAYDFQALFSDLLSGGWMNPATRAIYRHAWQGSERLDAMFNWYRMSPIVVPDLDNDSRDESACIKLRTTPCTMPPLYGKKPEDFWIAPDHLVIWGTQDRALLPGVRDRLAPFCARLQVESLDDAGHWLLHTHATHIAPRMIAFLQKD